LQDKNLSEIWLKASVVGSLWASVEIIVGSFFHNLRVPLAGTILAMISVIIMVAFHRHWNEKGLLWRAGVVCALLKSISPSALLLGPMTGILSEALLMELMVRNLGGNIAGYVLGGVVALMSTIAHRIVNLLFVYGFDIVKVLVNFYNYAIAQIGISELKPGIAVGILLACYALMGLVSAVFGFSIGRKSNHQKHLQGQANISPDTTQNNIFQLKDNQYFSVKLLFFHLFTLTLCLVILTNTSIWIGALFILAYLSFSVFHYNQSLKHLKRPFFWVQVLLLTFIATLFYNGFGQGNIFSGEGLIAGLQMNLRAVLILVGFSSLSIELRNPVIKAVLLKKGFSQLYLSLGLAFSALPWIIKNLSHPKQILKQPRKTIADVVISADDLLEYFKNKMMRPKVLIITGEKHQGKTTFALQLTEKLKNAGKKVGGFVATGSFDHEQRSAFDILSLESGISKPLCSIHFEHGEQIGPFRFNNHAQDFGFKLLLPKNVARHDFIVIDEIGPMEMKGKGWAYPINNLMELSQTPMIWVVRKNLLRKVIAQWDLINTKVFDINQSTVDDAIEELL